MRERSIDLYGLLPAVYRIRDAREGYRLKALLDLISDQTEIIKRDIDGLWDDLFIETCQDWVIPYIADLVGTNPLHDWSAGRRADVAKTISYRRRKGTLSMLEEMAGDVTGWGAHAVPFFERLGWTQNLNHLRLPASGSAEKETHFQSKVGTVDLRDRDALDRLGGPLDVVSHSIDVRQIATAKGWYGLRKIGFFLWRLKSYTMGSVDLKDISEDGRVGEHDLIKARQLTAINGSGSKAYSFTFSPLGCSAPLFNHPRPERGRSGLTEELNLPGAIRPLDFGLRMKDYYGSDRSIYIVSNGVCVQLENILPSDLSCWKIPDLKNQQVAVDVMSGRLALVSSDEKIPEVYVRYGYGFGADLGGGPYERRPLAEAEYNEKVSVRGLDVGLKSKSKFKLMDAIDSWEKSRDVAITIIDNDSYQEKVEINLGKESTLVIQSENGKRPHLLPEGPIDIQGGSIGKLILNGLLIEGGISVGADLEELVIKHCTLVPCIFEDSKPKSPDFSSVIVDPGNSSLHLEIDHSIVGRLQLPEGMAGLTVRDSIVDGCSGERKPPAAVLRSRGLYAAISDDQGSFGPAATFNRTTVFGAVLVKEMSLASSSIFTGIVTAQRLQAGCIRFSYVPDSSRTPRRYQCQPDMAIKRMEPEFTSVCYGYPGYAQLSLKCAAEIRTGAEDGSEMGAFCSLRQPQREANLQMRLEEYLPAGLEAGLIHVT